MTGGEIAAVAIAGQVAKKVGEQVVEQSASVGKELLTAARDEPEFRQAAKSYAKRVAVKQALLTKLYEPIARMLGVAHVYFEGDFEKDMAEKLAKVPEERIVAPKPSIAAPAMQQLRFSLEEPDLKEMYLNLLATASDSETSASAHPAFVEVVKQLSAEEVPILNQLQASGIHEPVVELRRQLVQTGGGGVSIYRHLMNVINTETGAQVEAPMVPTWIDNWIRLGLVQVNYASTLSRPDAYTWVEGRPEYARCLAENRSFPGSSLEIVKGLMFVTNFGLSFGRAVGIVVDESETERPVE